MSEKASRAKAARAKPRPAKSSATKPRPVKSALAKSPSAKSSAAKSRPAKSGPRVLDRRALNRALLARQLLLGRARLRVPAAIEHLIGLQAQAPEPPYFGLWARVDGFRPEQLARLMTTRRVVRMALMRGTIQLVTARDALALRPVVQPVLDRWLASTLLPRLDGVDLGDLCAAGRALLDEAPRTFEALGKALQARWPEHAAAALGQALRALAPLVQVPPRGLWRASGPAAHATVESWLGRPLDDERAPDAMVLRYLGAFGPATVQDVQTWSGLRGLGDVIDRLRPRLRSFRDERGRQLVDVMGAPLPDADTPAPVRFVPEYDNLILAHHDRERIIATAHRGRLMTVNGIVAATVLVDGFVAATWKLVRERDRVALRITPFARLGRREREAVVAEGEALLDFAAGDGERRAIQFA